jgi:hypothetical protein
MIGPLGTVGAARYLYQSLSKALERMVRQYLRETGGRGPQGNAYLQGAVFRVDERMRKAREAAMTTATSNALVVVDRTKAAVQKAVEDEGLVKSKRTYRATSDAMAMADGYADGEKVDIGDQSRKRLEKPDDQLKEE